MAQIPLRIVLVSTANAQHITMPADTQAVSVSASLLDGTTWQSGASITLESSTDLLNWTLLYTLTGVGVQPAVSTSDAVLRVSASNPSELEPGVVGLTVSTYEEAADAGLPDTTISAGLALQLDDAGAGTTYIGEAEPGTASSAASWRIKRLVETGADLAITWAGGTDNFDKVWDDRLGLSYS